MDSKSKTEKTTSEALATEPMCVIPIATLKSVLTWLSSDHITMPQNEVRKYQKLLLTAVKADIEQQPKS